MAQEETERPRTLLLGKCNLEFHNWSFSKQRALGLWKLSPDLRISLGRKEKQAFFFSWLPRQGGGQEKGCWWTSAALPPRQAKPRGLEWTRRVSLVQKGRPCRRLRRWASTPGGLAAFSWNRQSARPEAHGAQRGRNTRRALESGPVAASRNVAGAGEDPAWEAPWQGWGVLCCLHTARAPWFCRFHLESWGLCLGERERRFS